MKCFNCNEREVPAGRVGYCSDECEVIAKVAVKKIERRQLEELWIKRLRDGETEAEETEEA